jgi:uncharacterized membrane protein
MLEDGPLEKGGALDGLLGLPLFLWSFSLLCDVAYLAGSRYQFWTDLAFYAIVGGLIGAVGAALHGEHALREVPISRRRLLMRLHVGLDVVAIALFAVNVWLRQLAESTELRMALLSAVGLSVLCVAAWLGRLPAGVSRLAAPAALRRSRI